MRRRFAALLLLTVLFPGAGWASPSARRCTRACFAASQECADGIGSRRCKRLMRLGERCTRAGRGCPTSTTTTTNTTLTWPALTTTSSTLVASSTTTSTTLPNLTGTYSGTLTPGSRCLDDPGHTGMPAPDPFAVTLHLDGFAADMTAHYTAAIDGRWNCVGGWDTGAPRDLTEHVSGCRRCGRNYYGDFPPAECGDGTWLVLQPTGQALTLTIYVGRPWECHNSFSGTVHPVPVP